MATPKKTATTVVATTAAPAQQLVVSSAEARAEANKAIALPEDMSWVQDEHDEWAAEDVKIPFIRILQALSPQINKREDTYVECAEEGMLINTANNQLFDGEAGVTVVPIKFQNNVTIWKPRAQGGGLVRDCKDDMRALDTAHRQTNGKLLDDDGNEVLHSALYYALLLVPNELPCLCLISMFGAGWKAAKLWNTRMKDLTVIGPDLKRIPFPPVFAGTWKLTVVYDSNDQGKFFRWVEPQFLGYTHQMTDGRDIMELVKQARLGIAKGELKAEMSGARVDAVEVPF